MENEVWKDIPEYEGLYQISNLGRIKSLDRIVTYINGREYNYKSKLLKPSLNSSGYYIINLSKNNKIKTYRLHQLVAITFLNHKPDGHTIIVDHIDNDKSNNNLSNLQLINQRENTSKDKRGNKKYSSKYIGVTWCKKYNKWISRISINNKQINLGYSIDEETASEYYQIALLILDKFKNNKQFRELIKQIYYTKIT